MSLKSSNPARRPAGNPRLAAAIARCKGSPTPEKRSELLERLMAAPLLVALHDLPEEIGRGGETAVRFLVQVRAEGGIVVCGFSSHESLSAMVQRVESVPGRGFGSEAISTLTGGLNRFSDETNSSTESPGISWGSSIDTHAVVSFHTTSVSRRSFRLAKVEALR